MVAGRAVLRGMVRAAVEIGTELGAAIILAAHRRWDRLTGRAIHIRQRFEDQDPDRVFLRMKSEFQGQRVYTSADPTGEEWG